MKNYAKPGEVLYHVGLSVEMLQGARYALVPGDPGRVEGLAKALDKKAVYLASHREFTSWLARVKGEPVLVMSSGMGGPNITFVVEELGRLGITTFIRVGT
ncbi:MAG: uridine phosphorylase, partial [Treponema sp.]|nr:uridine phosphorylase [Treponema sp.]